MNRAGPVVVIGAGPAGLAVADHLSRAGVATLVVEAAAEVGGLARSVELWGHRFDLGPHSFYSTGHPRSVQRWHELTNGNIEVTAPRRAAYWRGRMVAWPPGPIDLVARFGPVYAAALAASKAVARRHQAGPDAASVLRRSHGTRLVKDLVAPYCRKYLGLDPDHIDAGFADALLATRVGARGPVTVLTPSRGTGAVWRGLADQLVARGVDLRLSTTMQTAQVSGSLITDVELSDGARLAPSHVIATVAPTVLLRVLPPGVAAAARLAAPARDTLLVYLHVNDPNAGSYHYLTVYDEDIAIGRVTSFRPWRPAALAQLRGNVLCAEYWSSGTDDLARLDDAALCAKASDDMARLGIAPVRSVLDAHITRLPRSVPVLDLGHQARQRSILGALADLANLHLLGRHATHAWDGQEDSLLGAELLAERLTSTLGAQT